MGTSLDSDSLLFRFYEVSFSSNLGVSFPSSEAYEYCNLLDYLLTVTGYRNSIRIKEKLDFYHQNTAPRVKLHPLLRFLRNHKLVVRSLLDFGCGDGSATYYLANSIQANRVCGVDADEAILPNAEVLLNARCLWTTCLEELIDRHESFDLVTVIHSLHHISDSEHQSVLSKLASLINPKGIMYVLEDGRDGVVTSLKDCKSFDREFFLLDHAETNALYRRNDYWANEWTYERKLNPRLHSYRTLDDWKSRLESTGLNLVWSASKGFDTRRLHGVPSILIICRPVR